MQLHARNRIESSAQARAQRKCPTSSDLDLDLPLALTCVGSGDAVRDQRRLATVYVTSNY